MKRKFLFLIVVLAIILLVLAGFLIAKKKTNAPATTTGEVPFSAEQKDLPINQLPQGFPTNFPMPAGAKIVQNYEVTSSDNRLQSTRKISTSLSEADATKLYTDFFEKYGWLDVTTKDSTTTLLKKQSDTVLIAVRPDTTTKQNTVEVTLTQVNVKEGK